MTPDRDPRPIGPEFFSDASLDFAVCYILATPTHFGRQTPLKVPAHPADLHPAFAEATDEHSLGQALRLSKPVLASFLAGWTDHYNGLFQKARLILLMTKITT